MTMKKMCPCGRPLHFSDPHLQELIERQIAELGENIKVIVNGRAFMVPRMYIALHRIVGHELPALAQEFGFEEVSMR